MQHNRTLGQEASDYFMPTDDLPPRDVIQAPMRSSGRIGHMELAFEAGRLAMRCRISHPLLSQTLDEIHDVAIAAQIADDHQLALLRGGPVDADPLAADPLVTDDAEPHPWDADAPTRMREAEAEAVAAEIEVAEIGADPLVQLVVREGERNALAEAQQRAWVESEARRIEGLLQRWHAEDRPRGLVARVMAAVRGRAA